MEPPYVGGYEIKGGAPPLGVADYNLSLGESGMVP